MQSKQKIKASEIVPLFTATYQGTSTQQIKSAQQTLIDLSLKNINDFTNACEQILQNSEDRFLLQSISNFVKILSKYLVENKLIERHGPKDYVNKLEHMFDNPKISSQFKENIAFAYMRTTQYYEMSFQRTSQKINYLYKTKQSDLAILLSRAYIHCNSGIKAHSIYYQTILPLEFKLASQLIQKYREFQQSEGRFQKQKQSTLLQSLQQILTNLRFSLCYIPFQQYQTYIFNCLQTKELFQILAGIEVLANKKNTLVILREITQKIIDNIYRMRRIDQLPNLVRQLRHVISMSWQDYKMRLANKTSEIYMDREDSPQIDIEEEISLIKLLKVSFESGLLLILDENFDVEKYIFEPSFMIRKVFSRYQGDIEEGFMIVEDICFEMKSQCIQVQFNKLIRTILSKCLSVAKEVMKQLDTVLFSGSEQLKHFISSNFNTVLKCLNLASFQISQYMTNVSFIRKIETMIVSNSSILFDKQNEQLYFHSLLVLNNYIDDFFGQIFHVSIFQHVMQNFIEHRKALKSNQNQNHTINVLACFEKNILKVSYGLGFQAEQMKIVSEPLINYLIQQVDKEGLEVYTEYMKNFDVQDKITLWVFDKMFDIVTKEINQVNQNLLGLNETSVSFTFIKFLTQFFDLQNYKHLFQSTLARIFPIFQIIIEKEQLYMDYFFNLIGNVIKHLKYVPQTYSSWMANLFNHQRLQSQDSFKALVTVLKFIKPNQMDIFKYQTFVNFMGLNFVQGLAKCRQSQINARQQSGSMFQAIKTQNAENQHESKHKEISDYFELRQQSSNFSKKQLYLLMSFHQFIYYHSQYLTSMVLKNIVSFVSQVIISPQQKRGKQQKADSFSFIKGKYQLIIIILFRNLLPQVNQILVKLSRQDQLYKAIYFGDHNYHIEYDSPIFIKQQLDIMRKYLSSDNLQMTYANSSFQCVFWRFRTLYEVHHRKTRQQVQYIDNDSQDEEDEFQPVNLFKYNFKEYIKMVNNFPKPEQWKNINELRQVKAFIDFLRSDSQSNEWLKILIENSMTSAEKQLMEELFQNLDNVDGKYRQIRKVNKNI